MMRILIADDHAVARRGVRSLLESRSEWNICGEAVDGRDAIEKAGQLAPDVIVMDVSMPRMSGLEATQAIRQTLPETEILILTQHDAAEMVRQAFNAGARGYVIKSDLADDLVNAVEVVSQHKFFLSNRSWKLPGRENSVVDAQEILQRGAALETALRQSEERLRLAQSAADLGIWDRDVRTGALSWSAEMYRLYGLDPTLPVVSHDDWRKHVHPDDIAFCEAAMDNAIQEHKQFNVEFRAFLPSGEIRWLASKGRAFYDSKSQPVRILGVNIDITERKLSERALLESDQRLRSTFEQAAVGMSHMAPDGSLLRVNQSLCDILGYSREELQGMTLQQITHPDDTPQDAAEMQKVLAGEVPVYSREKRYIRKDGMTVWVSVSASVVRDSDGTPKYFITANQDITKRRDTEAALQESAQSLRLASEAANIGVWVHDLASGELLWTDKCKELFGLRRDAHITQEHFLQILHPDDRAGTEHQIQAAIASAGDYEAEYRVVLPDGSIRWISSKGKAWRDSSGRPWRMSGVALDITSRKKTEDSLRGVQTELEAQVEQRTAALRILSSRLLHLQDEERRRIARELHDSIGQYLSAIAVNTDRVIRAADTGTNGTRELLSESRELVQRCLQETRTLSYLLHPPLLDEMGFASAAKWYVQGFAERSGIQVDLELSQVQRLPSAIETALFRVLQEALTNIHRHSGAEKARVRVNMNAATVSLEVTDFGQGVAPDVLNHFRTMGAGAGVGLAGMRERVKELGGHMEIQSGETGTSIRVEIPVHLATTSPRPSDANSSAFSA